MFQPGVLFLGEEQGDNDTAELVHHQESHRRSLLPPKGQKCGLRHRPRHFQNVQVCSYITRTALLFTRLESAEIEAAMASSATILS